MLGMFVSRLSIAGRVQNLSNAKKLAAQLTDNDGMLEAHAGARPPAESGSTRRRPSSSGARASRRACLEDLRSLAGRATSGSTCLPNYCAKNHADYKERKEDAACRRGQEPEHERSEREHVTCDRRHETDAERKRE
jgi:hypothetical protein